MNGTSNLSQNSIRFQHNANNERIMSGLNNVAGNRAVAYDTNWHLYVISFESANSTKIYRDDVLVTTITNQFVFNGTMFDIGRGQNGNAFAPGGNFSIDDVQIFNFPLTLSQVEGIFYGTPAAIIAPTAMLNAVSCLGLDTATINFTMNQNNASTTTEILYGTGGNINANVPVAGPTSHGNGQSLSQALTGLLPETTYEYRVVSTNSAGITASTLGSFTTLATANMIYHWEFNNTFASSTPNVATFTATTPPTFVGNGTAANNAANVTVANAAGRDANTLAAPAPLMPAGVGAKSYAFRVLFNGTTFPADNQYIFGSGLAQNTQSFDVWATPNSLVVNSWGTGNDKSFTISTQTNV